VAFSLKHLKRVDFEVPREVDVLVRGTPFAEVLVPDANSRGVSCKTLDISGESVNFFCAIVAICKAVRSRHGIYKAYLESATTLFSPKVLLSFVDNDWRFWQFSSKDAAWQKVIVQNGLRVPPTTSKKENVASEVDLFFCFGETDKERFSKSFPAKKVLVTGSFKSNREPIRQGNLPVATWISQYHPDNDSGVHGVVELEAIRQFFTWALAEGLRPRLLLRSRMDSTNSEVSWFTGNLPDLDFDLCPNSEQSPYQNCDQSSICGTLFSTLGVEALSRGTPVAFFPFLDEHFVELQKIPGLFKITTASKNLNSRLEKVLATGRKGLGPETYIDSMARDEGNGNFWREIKKLTGSK